MSDVARRLESLGIRLPNAPPPVAAYVGWKRAGSVLVTAGQLPMERGTVAVLGKLGADVSLEEGIRAAELCVLNALAHLEVACEGNLDLVSEIVRVEGYVQAAPDFYDHSRVINGASELLVSIFGDRGRHSRIAVGCNSLPMNAAVELALWADVIDGFAGTS